MINENNDKCGYLDMNLSDEERAVDLVSKMTREEKYSQLTALTVPAIPRLGVNAYNWWSEDLHGVARDGEATSFPTGLGIASTWDPELLKAAGIIKKENDGVKVLGNGELTKKLTVKAAAFSGSAKEKIEKAGGEAEVV